MNTFKLIDIGVLVWLYLSEHITQFNNFVRNLASGQSNPFQTCDMYRCHHEITLKLVTVVTQRNQLLTKPQSQAYPISVQPDGARHKQRSVESAERKRMMKKMKRSCPVGIQKNSDREATT